MMGGIKNKLSIAEPPFLEITGLEISFRKGRNGLIHAVNNLNLIVNSGEIHAIVGESGSGKTVTALSILGLVDAPAAQVKGKILWAGRNLLELNEAALRNIRGREIAIIFQNAQASLNPALRIGKQVEALLRLHRGLKGSALQQEAKRMIEAVQLPDPERILESYAHECSGGMAQRVAIAMALACRPRLLIADEPTASLDATIATQIVELLRAVQQEFGLSILLISHDLRVVARLCDRVSVMYLGKIIETAPTRELFARPLHPYTQALLQSIDVNLPNTSVARPALTGEIPSSSNIPLGCPFHPRCPRAFDKCLELEPPLTMRADDENQGGNHSAACWLYE